MFGTLVKVVILPLIVGALALTGYTAWFSSISLGKEMAQPKGNSRFSESITSGGQPGVSTNEIGGPPGPEPEAAPTCKSKECLILDEYIVKRMNPKLDPCDNFYKFACNKSGSISYDEHFLSSGNITSRLRDILSESDSSKDSEALKKAKQMFQICMKLGTPEKAENLTELKNMISEVGGWWLQPNWDEENFSLVKFYEKSVELGYLPYSLFTIDILQHPDRMNEKIITLTKPSFTEPWYGWPLQVVTYVDVNDLPESIMHAIAKQLGISQTYTLMEQYSNSDREKEVSETYAPESEFTILKLSELERKSPGIPWAEILQGVFKPMKIDPDQEILVECEQCLTNLANTFVTKDKKALASYLIWHLIVDNIVDNNFELLLKTLSLKSIGSKEDHCTLRVSSLFRKVLNYEYVNRYLDGKVEPDLRKLIDRLKASFEKILRESKYLDSETRRKSVEKLSSMKFYTPYDREVIDKNEIAKYYSEMQIKLESSFFQSLLNVRKQIIKQTINSWRDQKPIRACYHKYWENNVEYDEWLNAVFLSAGVLEGLTFSRNLPNYLNYGVLGSIIGREIARGFSLNGRSFDKTGKRSDWWSKQSKDEQDRRVQCFLNEYNKYSNETINEKMKAEIILDNDGVQISYQSYVNTPGLQVNDGKLPSFEKWANRQMFWINYASGLCVYEAEEVERRVSTTARINVVVSSSKEFVRDFQCKSGARMNSGNKCNLWL